MFARSRGAAENIHQNNRSLVHSLKQVGVPCTPPRLRVSARTAFFLCRRSGVLAVGAVVERFDYVLAGNAGVAIQVGDCACDLEHAMIAAR